MTRQIVNKTITVNEVEIFYREAGKKENPAILLLHGFPTSSVMFKNLMIALADKFYLVAPDFPGFGFSSFPDPAKFEYTFKNISDHINRFTDQINLKSFTIYLHDFGCPVGLGICVNHPEKIERIIVQSGNAYMEGIEKIWDEIREYWQHPSEQKKKKVYAYLSEEGTKSQYYDGLPQELYEKICPETWILDWERMSRPGNIDMQYALSLDYKNHIDMFPVYQEYFRKHQPPALIIWGRYEIYYNVKEAVCYKRDLPNATVHILDGGHMVLETNFDEVMNLIRAFFRS